MAAIDVARRREPGARMAHSPSPFHGKGGATTADWLGRERCQPTQRASAKDGASKRTRAQRERRMALRHTMASPDSTCYRQTLSTPFGTEGVIEGSTRVKC